MIDSRIIVDWVGFGPSPYCSRKHGTPSRGYQLSALSVDTTWKAHDRKYDRPHYELFQVISNDYEESGDEGQSVLQKMP